MSTPFMGQIEIFSFNFAPKGWAQCNGQLLPINQNQALFSLLGTTYGGDGRVNFGLPDLRSRLPISFGPQNTLGARGGEENHTLISGEMAQHTHQMMADGTTGRRGLNARLCACCCAATIEPGMSGLRGLAQALVAAWTSD